jgi:hypothetical protein
VDIIKLPATLKRSLSEERQDKARQAILFCNLFEAKEDKTAENLPGEKPDANHFLGNHNCSSPKSEYNTGLQKRRLELDFQAGEKSELSKALTKQSKETKQSKKQASQTADKTPLSQREESSAQKPNQIAKPSPVVGKNIKSDEGPKPKSKKQDKHENKLIKTNALSKKSSSERQTSEKEKSVQQLQETFSVNHPGDTHGSSQGRSSTRFKDIPTLPLDSRYVAEHGITNLTMDHETWPQEAPRTNAPATAESCHTAFRSQDIKQLMEEDTKSIARKFLKKIAKEFSKVYNITPATAESLSKQLQERIEKALLSDHDVSSTEESFKKNYTFKLAELVTLVKVGSH